MVKKILKYAKFVVCCALIVSFVAPSYAALSASDGAAFVTKAEFDAALADFNSRLTTFEAGINSKIDSQVTSYLDRNGIWNGKSQISPSNVLGMNLWDTLWGPVGSGSMPGDVRSTYLKIPSEDPLDYEEPSDLVVPITTDQLLNKKYCYYKETMNYKSQIGWGYTCLNIFKLFDANKSGLFKFTMTDWADGTNVKALNGSSNTNLVAINLYFTSVISKHNPLSESPYIANKGIYFIYPLPVTNNSIPRYVASGQFFVSKGDRIFMGVSAGAQSGAQVGVSQTNSSTYLPTGARDVRFVEADIY